MSHCRIDGVVSELKEGGCDKLIALIGNPNVGKTVVFNALTGSSQSTGNFPGVTVARKHGVFQTEKGRYEVVDLPGSYSLAHTSPAEIVTREWILENKPDVIVNVVDASNLRRNLVLTTILMELGIPVLLVLNMVDVAHSKGIKIDHQKLGECLGVPTFPLVAKNKGRVAEFKKWLANLVENQLPDPQYPQYGEELLSYVEKLRKVLSLTEVDRPTWLATKLLEGDNQILKFYSGSIDESQLSMIEDTVQRFKDELSFQIDEPDMAFSHARSVLIQRSLRRSVKRDLDHSWSITNQMDEVLTHRWLGVPIFVMLLWVMFQLTFELAAPFMEYIDLGFVLVASLVEGLLGDFPLLVSLINDGAIAGVGGIVVFLPNIIILFLAIGVLEDSGYLARSAFIMDRLMVRLGMEGRSFVPMLMGFGCNVPAIMATRNIAGNKERLQTIFASPFMSCAARLPVYILFAGIFFPQSASEVVLGLYLLGIVVAVLVALLFKYGHPQVKGFSTPLMLEMPPFLQPTSRSVGQQAWKRASHFVQKAGTVILVASILIWFMSHITVDPIAIKADTSGEIGNTLVGLAGKLLEPFFSPLQFNWRLVVGLIFGVVAKEVVVAGLGVLYVGGSGSESSLGEALLADPSLSQSVALGYMVFVLLYIPCIATLAAIKAETGKQKWALFTAVYTFVTAYIVSALIIYSTQLVWGL